MTAQIFEWPIIPIKPADRVQVTYYDGRCSRCKRANKWSGFDF